MWAAQSFWFQRIWRIVAGGKTIGAFFRNETQGFDPPRFLYVQLDYYMHHYVERLEKRVLAGLERLVFYRKSSTFFPLFLATFVFLATVEGDSWRMRKWKARLEQWSQLDSVSFFALMSLMFTYMTDGPHFVQKYQEELPRWNLPEPPDFYRKQNIQHARIVVAHVRSCYKGSPPFFVDATGKIKVNISNGDQHIIAYVNKIQDELRELGQFIDTVAKCGDHLQLPLTGQ